MFARLTATLALALACAAHPLLPNIVRNDNSAITLPIAKRYNFTGPGKLIEADRARVSALFLGPDSGLHGRQDVSITNEMVSYIAQVSIGSPATQYNLIVDTGSSNTWVGAQANNPFKPSRTTHETFRQMHVKYGSGQFSGREVIDQVQIGDIILKNQGIGAASSATGFPDVDGILGIGPVGLTQGSLAGPDSNTEIPTVTDTAYNDGIIPSKLVGVYFQPAEGTADVNGEITFGTIDDEKYTGNLNTMKITEKSPASNYVGIEQSVTYGESETTILASGAGIVDTGTTLVLLSTDAFNNYQKVTGAQMDSETTGLLYISNDAYDDLESLYFNINGQTYEFTKNAQIWPRSLNDQIGGQSDRVYLIVSDIGADSGGLDFINGQSFLERFYTVYDEGNGEFSIATTAYTDADTN